MIAECTICKESKSIKKFKKYITVNKEIRYVKNCIDCASLDKKLERSRIRKIDPKCNHCSCDLNSNNWYKSHQKYCTYSCIDCHKNLDSQSFTNHKNGKLKRYGINYLQYKELSDKQNGVCAICFKEEKAKTARLTNNETLSMAVDHCHTTGKVRGLLCMKCNRAIGLLEDSIDNLNSAIKYLTKETTNE